MNLINEIIMRTGIVPVIKLDNPQRDAADLARALCRGGVPIAEVTFRAAGADAAIRLMKEACPEMTVGAGTVTTTEQIALPGRLAVNVAACSSAAEVAEIIRREVYQIMSELAGYQYNPDKYAEQVRERMKWGTEVVKQD